MTNVLVGAAAHNIFSVSGLAKVTDQTKLPTETTWCTADGYYITATGTDLGLDATGTYSGTAKDLRISDSSGTVLLDLRGVNVPLFPLTSGFNTASFMGGDDTLVLTRSSGLVELDDGAGSGTAEFSALAGYTQELAEPKTPTTFHGLSKRKASRASMPKTIGPIKNASTRTSMPRRAPYCRRM